MSTTVRLFVSPKEPIDHDRHVALPGDLAALLRRHGQKPSSGLAKAADGPRRYDIHLSGPDRIEAGKALMSAIRSLGYEADVKFAP